MSSHGDFLNGWVGISSVIIFIIAYLLVMVEEYTKFRKSKPVILAAGLLWLLVAVGVYGTPEAEHLHEHFRHNLLEYSEILLFLLVAMSYINVLEERKVFGASFTIGS